jgi:hypothetical protein
MVMVYFKSVTACLSPTIGRQAARRHFPNEHRTPPVREQAFNTKLPSFSASVTWMLDVGC